MRYWILKALPKNMLSRLMGCLASCKKPKLVADILKRWFISTFQIDMTQAELSYSAYASLQELFARRLKPGMRIVEGGEGILTSPCDGAFGYSGTVENGLALQVKGRPYKLSHLLGDNHLAHKFDGGQFATLYLSPKDYHRFHMPCTAELVSATYLPGYLWPVNMWAVKNIEQLFCVNERIVMIFKSPTQSNAFMALVAVGATMVGKTHVNFDASLTTNSGTRITSKIYDDQHRVLKKGEELGWFEFGSTIVMLATANFATINLQPMGTSLKMGQTIGVVNG